MDLPDEMTIPLSRTKIMLMLAGGIFFVVVGIVLYRLDDAFIRHQHRYNDPEYVHFLGLAAMVFGALVFAACLWKMFDRKPGLIFTKEGMTDNSSAFPAGLVPWRDITGAQLHAIRRQRFITILVADPGPYLARGGWLRRSLAQANYRMTGGTINIAANGLAIKFDELTALFEAYWARYGTPPSA